MKVNSVRYKWVRYSRVNAIHVNSTQLHLAPSSIISAERPAVHIVSSLQKSADLRCFGALSGLIFRQVQSSFIHFARMYKLHKCNDFTQCNFSIAMIPNSVKFEINKPSL